MLPHLPTAMLVLHGSSTVSSPPLSASEALRGLVLNEQAWGGPWKLTCAWSPWVLLRTAVLDLTCFPTYWQGLPGTSPLGPH